MVTSGMMVTRSTHNYPPTDKALHLESTQARQVLAAVVNATPDLNRPRGASLFYEILVHSVGGGDCWSLGNEKMRLGSGITMDVALTELGLPDTGFCVFGSHDGSHRAGKIPLSLLRSEFISLRFPKVREYPLSGFTTDTDTQGLVSGVDGKHCC